MKITLLHVILISLGSILLTQTNTVKADVTTDALHLPDYKGNEPMLASTFYWYSSVEIGVCYNPKGRVGSIKGAIHCNAQGTYDKDNNSWTLPQTCVALQPLGGPLSSAVKDSCKNAGGVWNSIQPAASNTNGAQAESTIKQGAGGAGAGAGAGGGAGGADAGGDAGAQGSEGGGEKKGGGFLGGIFGF